MKNEDAITDVLLRNQFYRRQFHLALGAFVVALILIGCLIFFLVNVVRYRVQPLYFATDSVGRLIQVLPVSTPNMSLEDTAKWAVNAVEKATSYDYINYRLQMQSAEKYFVPYGWKEWMKAIQKTGNLLALNKRQMIFIGKVQGQPKLINEGVLAGAYAWKFEMPLYITYMQPPYDEASSFTNALVANVIVQRQTILQSTDGLGIVQLLVVEPEQAKN
jgi:intracellular multiplication protein IcmL